MSFSFESCFSKHLNMLRHDLPVRVGSLSRFKIITIDITQRSIRVQTYDRKFRGSLCSLPRKLIKVTPSEVKVILAEKYMNIFHITKFSATYSFLLCCINIIDYNRLTFDTREH